MTTTLENWTLLAVGPQTLVLAKQGDAVRLLECDAGILLDFLEHAPDDLELGVVTLLHPNDAPEHGAIALLDALADAADEDRFKFEIASGPGSTEQIAKFLRAFGRQSTFH